MYAMALLQVRITRNAKFVYQYDNLKKRVFSSVFSGAGSTFLTRKFSKTPEQTNHFPRLRYGDNVVIILLTFL